MIRIPPSCRMRLEAHEFWSHIADLLPSEQDQLLVECVFGHGLKPCEVSALYRDRWRRQRDVSVDSTGSFEQIRYYRPS